MAKSSHSPFGEICGYTTVGERGQIVIPKVGRDRLQLKTGARFLVVEHDGTLVFVPAEKIQKMVNHVTGFLNKIKK